MIRELEGPLDPELAEVLAGIQARAYSSHGLRPWSARDFVGLLQNPSTDLLIYDARNNADHDIRGFLLGSAPGDEAEILSIAVDPEWQRRGAGRHLMDFYRSRFRDKDISRIILEVAENNLSSINFYHSLMFSIIATRPDYYNINGNRVNALIMERCIGSNSTA